MDYNQHIKNLLIKDDGSVYKTNKNKTAIALVDIIEDEIKNINYEDDKDITYLFMAFDVLQVIVSQQKNLQTLFYDRFTYIHNMLANYLHATPNLEDKKTKSKYLILKNVMNKMENTMLILYLDNPTDYDPLKEQFIHYILFKLQYINFFKSACDKFPHMVNSVDKDGIPLAETVLNKYLESLEIYLSKPNLGPIDDLIYYDKALRIIFENEKVNIDDYNKKLMLEKIKEFAKSIKPLTNRHKEKLSFFINDVINVITNDNELSQKNTLDYLSYKYEIHSKFKEAHVLEANSIYINKKDIGPATTKRKIYTFDGEGAMEIDDGLSITYEDGIYHLGVHIADPGSYIPFDSILTDEAIRRTTSLYMSSYCIPLYPFNLSGDRMSLNEGKTTYCMSYYFDIDEITGEMLNFEIKNEICEIAGNLTYDYYNEIMDKGSDDKEFFDILWNLTNVSEILKQVYNKDIIYRDLHNDNDEVNENGTLKKLSQSVVESAMIYTNYNVAKLFSERDLPFIYRCHEINNEDIDKLTKLQSRLREKENTNKIISDIEMMKSLYPRAYYTRFNKGHKGLNIDYYTHATSPLRRLADNIVNICIKKFILGEYTTEDIKRTEELIDELSETINNKRRSCEDYEIQYMHMLHKD